MDEVKAIITLRTGRKVEQPMPKLLDETKEGEDEELEMIVIKEDMVKRCMPPPFPQAVRGKKGVNNSSDIIKQVPTYAKFLKDLCTVKRGMDVSKKAFLIEQVSVIIQYKTPVKYKDPTCPTILVNIRRTCVEKAFLDLRASVNLLPYSVYKKLGLGELKPTAITLSLADRYMKIPEGIVEDVSVNVDKFYFPINFVILNTEPVATGANYVPIIAGRPILATSNAIINFRNGVMQLTFGTMTMELIIFHLNRKHVHLEEEGLEEVCLINIVVEENCAHKLQEELRNNAYLNYTISKERSKKWDD